MSSGLDAVGITGLLEGAGLGWISRGTCNAGDIRVHLEWRGLPQGSLSLLGAFAAPNRIAAHSYENGARELFVRRGRLSLSAFTAEMVRDSSWRATLWRALAFVLAAPFLALPALLSGSSALFPLGGVDWSVQLIAAAALVNVVFWTGETLLWAAFYGLDDALPAFAAAVAAAAVVFGALAYSKRALPAPVPTRAEPVVDNKREKAL